MVTKIQPSLNSRLGLVLVASHFSSWLRCHRIF